MATEVHTKRCSPSKLELELVCSMASEFFANQKYEDPGLPAIYGSQVHLIGETMIRNALGVYEFDEEPKSVEDVIKECNLYDDEMHRLADSYASAVIKDIEFERKRTGEEPFILIESTLDMTYLVPDGKEEIIGTLDFGYISNNTLVIDDLKTGRIIKSAGEHKEDGSIEVNPQLGCYCSSVLHHYGSLYQIEKIRLVIHQEKMKSVSEMEMTIDEFRKWENEVLIPGVARIFSGKLEAVVNPGCKYCPGAGTCSARMEANKKTVEGSKTPDLMTDEEIEEILPKLDDMSKFIEDVKAQAVKRIQNGHKFKSHKLVYSSTKRTFKDSEKVAQILKENGYEAYSKPKLMGITEVQKQLGKPKMMELLGHLITITNGSITVAPLDDPREEVEQDTNKNNTEEKK